MKNTYGWIGAMPMHWQTSRIGHLYTERKEKVSDRDFAPLSVTMKGILPQLSTAAKTDAHDDRKLVRVGDFAINSRSDRRGSCGISPYDGSVSLINTVLIPRGEMHPRYYDWLFHSTMFSDEFYKWGHGIVDDLWTTNWQDMKRISVPVPPFAEQRRIADFLDRRCAEIDGVIEATKKTIEEYKALKQSIITEAVTGQCAIGNVQGSMGGKRRMKDSGIEWIGEIPEEWECKPIKYVAKFQPACDTSKLNDESETTYIPMECLKNGYYVKNTALFGALSSSLTPFEEGDIAMAKVTPCFENGNIAIMNNLASEFGMGSSELFVYRPFAANARYILYWLQNDLFKQAACATMTGTGGLKRVSPYFAKNSCIPVPSSVEQREITEYLDEKCAEIDRLIAIKQQFLAELETYKKSVIYEYVTGKREVI